MLREPSRTGGRGTFAGVDYVVLDEPQSALPPVQEEGSVADSPQTENPTPVPEPEKPESAEPGTVEPGTEKPTPYKELTLQRTRMPPNPPENGGTASLFEQRSPEGKNPEPRLGRGTLDAGSARRERRLPGGARRVQTSPIMPADAQDRFRRLEAAFPSEGVIGARYLDSQALFAALPADDQEAAIAAAGTYRAICARTGQHLKALHNWQRQGNFRNGTGAGLGGAAPGEAGAAARNRAGLAALQRGEWPAGCSEFVLAESPEGAAWEAYFARFSWGRPPLWRDFDRKCPIILAWARCRAQGASFDTLCKGRGWPPSTAYRLRDEAAEEIARGFNETIAAATKPSVI